LKSRILADTACMKTIIAKLTVLIFAALYLSCKPKRQPQDKPFTWNNKVLLECLSYGFPLSVRMQNAESVVSERWGFRFKSVGGCIVTHTLADSVKRHNLKFNAAMHTKFGKNWYALYQNDLNKELALQAKAIALLYKEKLIIKKRKILQKENHQLNIFLVANQKPLIYDAYVTGYQTLNQEPQLLQFYRYEVNLNQYSAKLISDSVVYR
jgi:hypothetical protein